MIVPPTGVEPVISWMRTKCPGPLDDGGCQSHFRQSTNKINIYQIVFGIKKTAGKSKFAFLYAGG